MSAGAFTRSKYQASYGAGSAIHPIRVQPESLDLDLGANTNSPPDGAVNNPISAKVSLSARGLGLRPRFLTLQLAAPQGTTSSYKEGAITRVPVLTPGAFNDVQVGSNVTYLGNTWQVVSKTPETVR